MAKALKFAKKKKGMAPTGPIVVNSNVAFELFKTPALHADNVYASMMPKAKATLIRLTFAQYSGDTGRDHYVSAVSMAIEDIQRMYDVLGKVLQTMREAKRIE